MGGSQGVVVFLDWQNVYMCARDAFHAKGDPHTKGQVHPVDLALTLAERAPPGIERELSHVRIYRGMPEQRHDSHGYAAARRQISSWSLDHRVVTITRPLRYPEDWVAGRSDPALVKEKGVDVALALDFAAMAADGLYDVGILMSGDQDLVPALERVHQRTLTRNEGPVMEVAAWRSTTVRGHRLSIGKGKPFCHWLDQETYWGLMDDRNYARPSPTDMRPRRRPA